jgi:hypothetical protein
VVCCASEAILWIWVFQALHLLGISPKPENKGQLKSSLIQNIAPVMPFNLAGNTYVRKLT